MGIWDLGEGNGGVVLLIWTELEMFWRWLTVSQGAKWRTWISLTFNSYS